MLTGIYADGVRVVVELRGLRPGRRRGDSMAKAIAYRVSGRARPSMLSEISAALQRRLHEALGFALLLACLLLAAALLTYDPRDGSLNTAVDGPPRNLSGS